MAQHILMKDGYIHSLVMLALNNRYSLKWNVRQEENPLSRIDLEWIKQQDKIDIPKKELKNAKVFYVEIFKPLGKLKKLLQDEPSFHFEVFEFDNDYLVYWVI